VSKALASTKITLEATLKRQASPQPLTPAVRTSTPTGRQSCCSQPSEHSISDSSASGSPGIATAAEQLSRKFLGVAPYPGANPSGRGSRLRHV
jgi:hypothetical protein